MSNNPAASAALQLGSIFTALVSSVPFESLLSPPRTSHSTADVNHVIKEANTRIRVLNQHVRKLKNDGSAAVAALQSTVYNQAEYIIELETQNRILLERIAELESQEVRGSRTLSRPAQSGNASGFRP